MADNLKNCHRLFTGVRKKLEKTYHTSIPIDCQGQSRFTMYFPVLICADAVGQARRSSDYNFAYWRDGLNLKFGVYPIYIGTSNEDLQLFQDAHRKWRAKCAIWEQTKTIAEQGQNLDNIAAAIQKQLQKFTAMEHLPGRCELCC